MEDAVENTAEGVIDSSKPDSESATKDDSSRPDNYSTLSRIPRPCTTPFSGDPAACLSIALVAYQHARHLAFQNVGFLNTLPGFIKHSEGMEATGQG